MHRLRSAAWIGCLALVALGGSTMVAPTRASAAAAERGYRTINDPLAGSGPGQGTVPSGINNRGDLVGNYYDSNGIGHGFLERNGDFTTIDDPAAMGSLGGTDPLSINEHGVIAGFYLDNANVGHGFVLRNGTFATIDDPAAGSLAGQGTFLDGDNDHGLITGTYFDIKGVLHGFTMHNGRITNVTDPRAGGQQKYGTILDSANNHGVVAGNIVDKAGVNQGLLYHNGNFSALITDPKAGTGPKFGQGTFAYCVNNHGAIAGQYVDSGDVTHGYWLRHGVFHSVDIANATLTSVQCLSDNLTLVGYYVDSNLVQHGFAGRPDRDEARNDN